MVGVPAKICDSRSEFSAFFYGDVSQRYGDEGKFAEHVLEKGQLDLDAVLAVVGSFILLEKNDLVFK